MRALAASLLVLVAGCVGSPAEPAALLDPALDPGARFLSVVSVIDPAGGHGEPSFGVAPDGTLFANGVGDGLGGAVYRSTDDGATWERIADPVEPMPNFDPDLAVARDGTVWFSALWLGCSAVAASADLGETWTSNPAACNTLVADRQYVVPTEGGTAYLYSHQLPTFFQMAAKTTDHGRTWVPTAPVEGVRLPIVGGTSGWGGGGFWNAATGSVFFTWTTSDWVEDGGWDPAYAVTRDEGASWSLGSVPSQGGAPLGLGLVVGAADEAGNVYLAWGETFEDTTAIWFAASTDDGKTWNAPVRVDASTNSKVFPAITAGAPGKVAVAYYEADEPGFPSDVKGAWNVTLAWTSDATAAEPNFAYGALSEEPVKTGGICINGTSCRGDREFADYFQVHVLPDGRVGAIYNKLPGDDVILEVYVATREPLLR